MQVFLLIHAPHGIVDQRLRNAFLKNLTTAAALR
jgi:hypothetical protein